MATEKKQSYLKAPNTQEGREKVLNNKKLRYIQKTSASFAIERTRLITERHDLTENKI